MKNEVQLLPIPSANFITTDEGRNLIIKAKTIGDSGNFTCIAKNIASTRKSFPAAIIVSGAFELFSEFYVEKRIIAQ